jgi:hypothetical protein
VKRGETDALRLLGYGKAPAVAIENIRFSPRRVAIGGRVSLSFELRSTSRTPQDLLVDIAVHFVKARGKSSRKVFKVKRVLLAPRGKVRMSTSVSLAVHTTRKPNPGTHRVGILVNGKEFPAGAFEVTGGATVPRRGNRRSQ